MPTLPSDANPHPDAGNVFRHAILRRPGASLVRGLTTADLGPVNLERARRQHRAYADALRALGLEVTVLAPDEAHPDSVFIEDAALLAGELAVLTRPGAPSRRGEPGTLEPTLRPRFAELARIEAPGTLDAGDVLRIGDTFFVGLSSRTNAEGARQLAARLEPHGFAARTVDVPTGLHLKSAVASLGAGRVLATPAFAPLIASALGAARGLDGVELVTTAPGEERAANSLAVNGRVLVPAGYPRTLGKLRALGVDALAVDVGEFEKLDGGLSCLSLRY